MRDAIKRKERIKQERNGRRWWRGWKGKKPGNEDTFVKEWLLLLLVVHHLTTTYESTSGVMVAWTVDGTRQSNPRGYMKENEE
jgi:hypothetical protein